MDTPADRHRLLLALVLTLVALPLLFRDATRAEAGVTVTTEVVTAAGAPVRVDYPVPALPRNADGKLAVAGPAPFTAPEADPRDLAGSPIGMAGLVLAETVENAGDPSVTGRRTSDPDTTGTRTSTSSPRRSTTTTAAPRSTTTTAPRSTTTAPRPTTTTTRPTTTTTEPPTTTTTEPPTTTTTAAPTTTAPPATGTEPAVTGNQQVGVASWHDYSKEHGYHPRVCAHRTLPMGTVVTVTNTRTGASTTCVVDDRGPFVEGRVIDLHTEVFAEVSPLQSGTFPVRLSW